MQSALYEGRLMHARTRPVAHRFAYPLWMWSIELDELPELARRLRLFAHNRRHVLALWDRDHDGAATLGLRAAAVAFLRAGGVPGLGADAAGWRFRLLTHVRVAGYVFNPVTFTTCTAPDGRVAAVIAEVRNTFGKVHRYLLDERARVPAARGTSYATDKLLHVSPFFDLALAYRFHFRAWDETLDLAMDVLPDRPEAGSRQPLFHARLTGTRRPLDDRTLASLLLRYPFVTTQVIAKIHWQALVLWLRGAPFHSEPAYDPEAARRLHARPDPNARAADRGGGAAACPPGQEAGARGARPLP